MPSKRRLPVTDRLSTRPIMIENYALREIMLDLDQ
jgi:hypothetical protein